MNIRAPLITLTLLSGCAPSTEYCALSPHTQSFALRTSLVTPTTFIWTDTETEARALCQKYGLPDSIACYVPSFALGTTSRIIAKHPSSWNDHCALAVVGHELSHALGASHE